MYIYSFIYISSLVLHKPTESTVGCKVFIAKNGYLWHRLAPKLGAFNLSPEVDQKGIVPQYFVLQTDDVFNDPHSLIDMGCLCHWVSHISIVDHGKGYCS